MANSDVPSETGAKLVLLAEDNENDIALFKRAFAQAGIPHKLRVVRDGGEVVAYLMGRGKYSDRNEYPLPALLLLDLKMPAMNGFEVLQWARVQPETKELPIIVLATSAESNDVKLAYRLGANSFITKSDNLEEFVGQMKHLHQTWL